MKFYNKEIENNTFKFIQTLKEKDLLYILLQLQSFKESYKNCKTDKECENIDIPYYSFITNISNQYFKNILDIEKIIKIFDFLDLERIENFLKII